MDGITVHRIRVEPEPFDLLTASEALARSRYDLLRAVRAEVEPGDPIPSLDAVRLEAQYPVPWTRRQEWVVLDGDRVAGWARLELEDLDTNRHLAECKIEVARSDRRRGIGTQLLDAVGSAAREDGRTVLGTVASQGAAAEPFLAAVGGQNRQVFRVSRMQMAELDVDLMRAWVDGANERASGYTLVGWDDPCPPEYADAFSEVVDVMNTAPLDDLDWEDEHYTPEQIREWQDRLAKRGHVGWVYAARDDATGHFAGFTEMGFWPWSPELAYQGDTGVHPDHRNLGIGRWLKAAMVLRLMDERAARAVETGNAGSNRPMLAINEAMGFRPHRIGGFWQLPLSS
jgi:GNAT superfamily N-acetyltransferase